MIQDFETRRQVIAEFCDTLTGGQITVDIHKLTDGVGPSGSVEDIQALILTKEVEKGGHFVNRVRSENEFHELVLEFVEIITLKEEGDPKTFDHKTSSSHIRATLDDKNGNCTEIAFKLFIEIFKETEDK